MRKSIFKHSNIFNLVSSCNIYIRNNMSCNKSRSYITQKQRPNDRHVYIYVYIYLYTYTEATRRMPYLSPLISHIYFPNNKFSLFIFSQKLVINVHTVGKIMNFNYIHHQQCQVSVLAVYHFNMVDQ